MNAWRDDEIAAMAAAVQVFKDTKIVADHLAAEKETENDIKVRGAGSRRCKLPGDQFARGVMFVGRRTMSSIAATFVLGNATISTFMRHPLLSFLTQNPQMSGSHAARGALFKSQRVEFSHLLAT